MGEVLSKGAKPHYCDYPGWWRRRRLKLQQGAVWRCDCGRQWVFVSDDFQLGAYWRDLPDRPLRRAHQTTADDQATGREQ